MTGTPLTYEEVLRKLREQMREAVRQTQGYDAKWNRLNDELNTMLDALGARRNASGEWPISDLDRAGRKADSLALKDALSAGNWWRAKAVYLATVIQAEIATHNELEELRMMNAQRRL